jgi:anti-sigma factor RsiW
MRGKISDQDLTDYALNELQPEERLYVESMLAVSEPCRNDVYEMIELAQMLEEGFEREDGKIVQLGLNPEQREQLLSMKVPGRWLAKTASVLAAAACVAFAITQPGLWEMRGPAKQVARTVSTQVSNYVTDAVNTTVSSVNASATATASSGLTGDSDDVVTQLGVFRRLAPDPAFKKWFSHDWLATETEATSTPWIQPAATWDPMPRASLDMP